MRGKGKGSLILYSGEGWKKESEAPGRKRQEVYGDKEVKKRMLIKHNEEREKAVCMDAGGTTVEHQETADAKGGMPTVPKCQAEKQAKTNQH